MLKLNELPDDFLDRHLIEMNERFDRAFSGKKYKELLALSPKRPRKIIDFLADNREKIFVAKPKFLRRFAKIVSQQFPRFSAYARVRPSGNSSIYDESLASLVKIVELLFDYDSFSDKKRSWSAYNLVSQHAQRICPYCQLSHLEFYMESSAGGFKMRPPLDHFYPRSAYPYLAVSAFNLVPSCVQCNSSVKRDIDPLPLNLAHPHINGVRVSKVGIDFHVHRDLPVGEIKSHSEIQLQLIPQSRSSRDWLHFFKLAERYDWYTPEVFDLYKRAARFSDLGSDWKDVPDLRMGYLLGYEATEAESRPLGVCLRQISEKILRDLDKDYP